MRVKNYYTYAQIDAHLEILKLEREIHRQKTMLNLQKMKGSLRPSAFFRNALGSIKTSSSNSYLRILVKAIPFIVMWFMKSKRGK